MVETKVLPARREELNMLLSFRREPKAEDPSNANPLWQELLPGPSLVVCNVDWTLFYHLNWTLRLARFYYLNRFHYLIRCSLLDSWYNKHYTGRYAMTHQPNLSCYASIRTFRK